MRRWGAVAVGGGLGLVLVIACSGTDETAPPPAATAAPGERCSEPTGVDCIRAVYEGAPGDYAQVSEIPADVLIEPDAHGRYQVERGQQVTVVTAAPLPEGYTRFYLARSPLGSPSPLSHEQLIQPVGTTYTFTVTVAEGGSNLITFDLSAANPPLRPGLEPPLGDVVVTTNFLVPTLRYDTLDITGTTATAGSYAFLKMAGDATSVADHSAYSAGGGVELRIHQSDASGTTRATFYDTVTVGDTFDYRTNGRDCGFRFRVTSVAAAATPITFGIERVALYGSRCSGPGAGDVDFVWGVRAGVPGPYGVQVMLHGEPVGEGTYQIEKGYPYIIDVPAGMRVVNESGVLLLGPNPNRDRARFSNEALELTDVDTGSLLGVDAITGREIGRRTTSSTVDDSFDQIMASIRTLN